MFRREFSEADTAEFDEISETAGKIAAQVMQEGSNGLAILGHNPRFAEMIFSEGWKFDEEAGGTTAVDYESAFIVLQAVNAGFIYGVLAERDKAKRRLKHD